MSFSTSPRQARTKVSWKLSRTPPASRSPPPGVGEAEVVDPDAVAAARHDRVGALVGDLHAHVLEQRQHVREHQRPPGAEQLRPQHARAGLERPVEADAEAVGLGQLLDVHDVRERRARHPVGAVGGREGVAVALEELAAAASPSSSMQRLLEVVGPRARGRHEHHLDLVGVEVGGVAGLDVGHEVEPHEHRLGHPRRVVDARRAGGRAQDRLDAAPVLGVEAVARHEHEQREEAAERVAAREQPQALALAEVEDPHRGLEELVLGDLEQLVARVGVEDLEQRLLVVAARREAGLLEHLGDAAAQDRDLGRARPVGGVRVEAEEAARADADEVEIGGAVDGRALVRLRERDRSGLAAQALGEDPSPASRAGSPARSRRRRGSRGR